MLTDSQEPPTTQVSQENDRDSGSGGPTSLFRDKILLGTVIGAFVLDQVSKRIITSWLDLGESWPSEGFFRITYGTNSGTAFGLFPNHTTLLIFVSLVAIGFLVYFYRAHAMPSLLLRFAIGLQLGGAFGNLIDRVLNGKVVDFIDVGPWPIFNLADSSIVVGIFILMAVFLLTKEPTGNRSDAQTAPVGSDPPESQVSSPASAQDE